MTKFKYEKDIMLFYIGECFRGEKPQKGRYRQFTQLGIEILNPTKDYSNFIKQLANYILENRPYISGFLWGMCVMSFINLYQSIDRMSDKFDDLESKINKIG